MGAEERRRSRLPATVDLEKAMKTYLLHDDEQGRQAADSDRDEGGAVALGRVLTLLIPHAAGR